MAGRAVSILHIFPSFSIGGQQRRLATLAEAFGPEFSHRILSLDEDVSASALFGKIQPKVESLVIEKSGFVTGRNISGLRKAIAASGAYILCTYNFGSIEAVIANRLGPRLPHVHHEDGFGPDEAGGRLNRKRAIGRRMLLANSIVVVPSKGLEEIALRSWRLPGRRVVRIPVGIDVARFRAPRGERTGPVTVGSIGSLRAEKNIARLIRCFEAAGEGRDARLVIYGDGPERSALIEQASQSKAGAAISFPGATSDAASALSEIDIFALSSDTEQMPTSLLEAMAAGLPAIATAVGEIPEMLGPESRDFTIDAGDEENFAAQLRRLIDDAVLRRSLGSANQLRAEAFDAKAMIEAFRRLYSTAASRGA